MTFITEIVAVQVHYKERCQEIDAEHATFVEAIESRFRRELEEREECYVEGRDAAIAFDVNARQAKLNNPKFDNEPMTAAAEQLGAEATELSNQRLEIDCGFEAVKKQRFICPNCPSLGGHRPQGRCRVCPDQD